MGAWRDYSEVKSIGCSYRGPGFDFQHPYSGSQSLYLLFQRIRYLHRNQAHTWRTDVHAGKAFTQ